MAYVKKANFIVMEYPEVSMALEDAIRLCNEAAKTFTEEDYPIEYSGAMNLLGMAYRRLSDIKNPPKNLELAISYYWRSLRIRSINEYDMASTYTNIAIAYRMLSTYEEDKSYIEKSKEALKESLKIRVQERYPYEHATTIYEMGLALLYEFDFTKDPENLVSAISNLSSANKVFEEYMESGVIELPFSPLYDYAFSNFFLGKAHAKLSEFRSREENLNKSREYLSKVLKSIPKEDYPENYADAAFELGNALFDLYKVNGSKENLLNAIDHYEESKSIFTLEENPFRYASIIDEMGKAYLYLAKESNLDTHINAAMWLFDESYNILSELDSPVKEEVLQNYKEAKDYYELKFMGGGLIYA